MYRHVVLFEEVLSLEREAVCVKEELLNQQVCLLIHQSKLSHEENYEYHLKF